MSSNLFFQGMMYLVTLVYGGYLIANGEMQTADLAMYALYIGIFISPIQILVELVEMMQKGLSGFRRFLDVMETEPEIQDAPDAVELKDVKGRVCYEDVSFHYSDDETTVLSHVSIEIPAGKSVALVGPSGGGKTTICSLLPRFYDVTGGRVTVDGQDIRSLTLKSLRSQIGVVQQDVYLFSGSIRDNIAYGKPDATEEEIIAAVTGFSSNINFQDDSFYLDGDTEFYDDGIMFCIYDKNGRLLYGTIPTQFPEETILKSNTPRMITGSNRKWMIYDSVYSYGDDEEMWVRGITSVHSIELFMQTSEKMLLIVFPLLIILIGAIGYFMIKRALRQVDLICDEVENISNGKDLSKRLSLPKAKDELYELSEKFNEMFERLEFSFEKERQFTSDVSHELRTPVAVIISQCEYLLENENLSTEDNEEIAVILRQAKRMSKLTSEMLMIARNEQGEQHLMEKLDFGLLSELVIEELQTKAQEKNIEITLQKQDDLFMNGDQTLILRMMMNLITNAINYGKTNGHIHVILKVENDQIVGEVKDDGIGISEEHLDKIWERFYRIDKSRSRENGGTGLGLSMVRWIVNLHNGTIHVESIEGIGTSFIFRFPKI